MIGKSNGLFLKGGTMKSTISKLDSDYLKRHLGHFLIIEEKRDALDEFAKTREGKELVRAMMHFIEFCNDVNFEAQKQ